MEIGQAVAYLGQRFDLIGKIYPMSAQDEFMGMMNILAAFDGHVRVEA